MLFGSITNKTDSPWSSRHRAYVKISVASVVVLVLSIVLFNIWYEPPTCFDGKKNQDEIGVDCGGQCSQYLLCKQQVSGLDVLFAKVFSISEGVWSAVAYVQHTNNNAYTNEARYKFEFYDVDGKFIGEREGSTFVGSEETRLVVIESKLDLGERTPYRVMFEWLDDPVWRLYTPTRNIVVEIVKLNYGVEIRAWLRNNQPVPVKDVEVSVLVFDNTETAIAVSTTYVEFVGPRESVPISFSWPHYFDKKITRTEFHYRVKQPD
jgi:hypothetical protein